MRFSILVLGAVLFFPLMPVSAASLYDLPLHDLDGQPATLAPYRGQVMLVVNVASKCGNTPQYSQLEGLYRTNQPEGFVVLGFPCNQFGGQEPGTNAEIKEFCSLEYQVTFPMFDKLDVNGRHRHPLYVALAGEGSPFPGDIEWNFAKFLVGRDGNIVARFPARMKPDDPMITAAIASALAVK